MAESSGAYRLIGARYQVTDTDRAIKFYTDHLGFTLDRKGGPVGLMSNNGFQIWLSGPGASGSQTLTDGREQKPGGWNRVAPEVTDLPACIEELKKAGVSFRNEMIKGPWGSQIQIEDPDGNPIELFEPAERSS